MCVLIFLYKQQSTIDDVYLNKHEFDLAQHAVMDLIENRRNHKAKGDN